jgi:hypothetical protein
VSGASHKMYCLQGFAYPLHVDGATVRPISKYERPTLLPDQLLPSSFGGPLDVGINPWNWQQLVFRAYLRMRSISCIERSAGSCNSAQKVSLSRRRR